MQATHAGRSILVYGASGHTGRFIVRALRDMGVVPVLAGRDDAKLRVVSSAFGGLEMRIAAIDDPRALHCALEGVDAVINAAGPFALTAGPMIDAAVEARVPYLYVAAEPDVVAATIARYADRARDAGVTVAPAIGFYGALGDLLATAAMGDWPDADAISLAYSLSSWVPTAGTRATIAAAEQRRNGRRVVFMDHRLELRDDEAPVGVWDFPAPIGRQHVTTQFTTADAVTISHHLTVGAISECMTLSPLQDLAAPDTTHPEAVDARGRSDQTFLVQAVVSRGDQTRRAVACGQDIYAVSAPLVAEAARRLLDHPDRWRGVVTAAQIGDARSYLRALVPGHLAVEFG